MGEESLEKEMAWLGAGGGGGDSPKGLEKQRTARPLFEARRANINPSGKLNPDSD